MNKLWVRLSLTYGIVILMSFAAIALVMITLFRANTERSLAESELSGAIAAPAELAAYFQSNGSWAGVGSVIQTAMQRPPPSSPPNEELVVLTDPEGNAIYGAFDSALTYSDAVPIVVDGQTQALLSVAQPNRRPFFPLWGILSDVGLEQLLLLTAIVVGVVSVLFGIIISRSFTRPLDVLSETAQDVGAGHLERRVPLSGSAETVLLAESFNTMVDQLQRAEKLRRDLVADVAHELRTPISALQANLYAILDDVYPMTKTEIAGLYEQTRLLSRLVDDLHELTQAEAGALPLNFTLVNLANALEDFAASFRIVAEGKGVTFVLEIPPDLPPVRADEQRLKQVLHNLLGNALRHTPEGGAITLSARAEASTVKIAIKDSGEGIAPEHLPHIFERFYRGDASRSRDTGGTGLGLAIAQAIVEAHDGTLTVSSDGIPGHGSTFTLRLPAAQEREMDSGKREPVRVTSPTTPVST